MSKAKSQYRRPLNVLFALLCCTAVGLPVQAADGVAPAAESAVPAPAARPTSAMAGLIRRLAERGILSPEDAEVLTKQAEADAADARVQGALAALASLRASSPVVNNSTVPAEMKSAAAASSPVAATQAGVAAAASSSNPTTPPAPDDDTVRVTYVPEVVKAQLREEIKNDVMQQAKDEHWAAPRTFPDWVSRFTLYGDFRMRYESIYNHKQNNDGGLYPNFNSINTGAPFDTAGSVNSPQYNVDQDRNRIRVRARLGAAVDLGEGFTSNFRIATGENNSPVSENQSFGAAGSGQGGNFSKYALWLDRAYLKYQTDSDPVRAVTATVGRFENPFLSTSIIWADDLGFDGAVLTIPAQIHLGGEVVDSIRPFAVIGAFPVFNTDLNFSSNSNTKIGSNDKWLNAAQVGLDLKIGKDLHAKFGAAYYMFTKTVGKTSTPYTPITTSDAGDTDARRPTFAQKGNTYMRLRDITADSTNANGNINQWQYYGLATAFRDVAFDGQLDYTHFEPFQISLFGEYVENEAFHKSKILARDPVNNLGASLTDFIGGGTAWIVGLKMGDAALQKRWDWNVNINYRNVESDAVIDGFCDSDFGGGGTNLKGLTLGANLALAKRVWLGIRWMSANQVSGPTFKNDILQMDINGKF